MDKEIKPVFLEEEKCKGCVSCMKRCPTEAIRVRRGKARIMYERCIGCGECVKICPTNAKKEYFDSFSEIENYKYKIAVPTPTLLGQFKNLTDINVVLTALKSIGFDDVLEAAYGGELISSATKEYLKHKNIERPVIGSSCAAITNLILMRYENLIPHLSPMKQPETVAAKTALQEAMAKTGLKRQDIGVFVITQCAAKVLELKKGNAVKYIDKVLSVKEVYFPLLEKMNKLKTVEPLRRAGKTGINWGCSTSEAVGIGTENYLSADGIENVLEVLNELEHDKLKDIDFVELFACPSGCVGGSMNIENASLAKMRLRIFRKILPMEEVGIKNPAEYMRAEPYLPLSGVYKLNEDRATAIKMTVRMKEIYDALPQIDCGACGAPKCMALAEDVVKGFDVKCEYKRK